MRLLHTSDLHLGALWRVKSRRDDQERVLDEVLGLCNVHNVETLLVTGDVFSDRVNGDRQAQVARRFLEQLRPHLDQGRAVVLLRGNHDPFDLFGLMRVFVDEMSKTTSWPLIVADLPDVYPVPGHNVQIVALPYITPAMLRDERSDVGLSPDQQLPGLAGLLAARVQRLYQRAAQGMPSIFAGHVLISGAQLTEDISSEAGYNSELWLDPSLLPQFTSYNALGHIHLAQQINGAGKPTWYAGSPDRMDLGERAYTPQVLLVDTPAIAGGVATVQPIPLTVCTPFIHETVRGMEEVGRFCEVQSIHEGPDPLGQLIISDVPAASRAPVEARVRHVAPRLDVRWEIEGIARAEVVDEDDLHDIPTVVASYIGRAYANREDRGRRLMDAFNRLWETTSEMPQ